MPPNIAASGRMATVTTARTTFKTILNTSTTISAAFAIPVNTAAMSSECCVIKLLNCCDTNRKFVVKVSSMPLNVGSLTLVLKASFTVLKARAIPSNILISPNITRSEVVICLDISLSARCSSFCLSTAFSVDSAYSSVASLSSSMSAACFWISSSKILLQS